MLFFLSLYRVNLRKAIVEAACNVGLKDAVKMATDSFTAWKDYGSRWRHLRLFSRLLFLHTNK